MITNLIFIIGARLKGSLQNTTWYVYYIPILIISYHVIFKFLSFKDVYIMIRRKKATILTDAKESSTVGDLKRTIEGL